MHRPQERPLYIPAASIPIEKDDVTSQYDSGSAELSVRSQLSAEHLLATDFENFPVSTEVVLSNANNPRLLDNLRVYLPPRLRNACAIFYYESGERKGTIALQPSTAAECLEIFQDTLMTNSSLSSDVKLLRETVRKLYRKYNHKLKRLPNDPRMVEQISTVENASWDALAQHIDHASEYREEVLTRDRFHERRHYMTYEVKWEGAAIQMVQLEGIVQRLKKLTLGPPHQDAIRLTKQINIFRGLLESEAYVHDALSTQIIEESSVYVHAEFCNRLLDLTKYFQKEVHTKSLLVERLLDLEEMESDDEPDFRHHAVGTILLLLGPYIHVDKLVSRLSLLSRSGKDTAAIEQMLLDKSAELAKDPVAAEAYMRQTYDTIQEMMKAIGIVFARELVQFAKNYSSVIASLGLNDVDVIHDYLQFLSEHPAVFMDEPLRIKRLERTSTQREVVNEERQHPRVRLFSLARKNLSLLRRNRSRQ